MIRSELWAVEYARLESFFRSQSDVHPATEGFRYGSCEIRLEALSNRQMGGLSFPQIRVTFHGEEKDVNSIYHRFFMRFISAGG